MDERIAVCSAVARHGDSSRYAKSYDESKHNRDDAGKFAAHEASKVAHAASESAGPIGTHHEAAVKAAEKGQNSKAATMHMGAMLSHERKGGPEHEAAAAAHKHAMRLHHEMESGEDEDNEREYAEGAERQHNRERAHRERMESDPTFAEQERDRSNSFLNEYS